MYDRLAHRLFTLSISLGVLREDDRELYLFAFTNLLSQIASWASLLILAGLFHLVPQMILYMVLFVPLRSFAGGYHERSYWRCFWLSVLSQIAVMLFIPWLSVHITPTVMFAILSVSAAVVAYYSPVPDANKPLSDSEFVRYRRVTWIILGVECAAIVGGFILGVSLIWLLFMSVAIVTVAFMLLVAKYGTHTAD